MTHAFSACEWWCSHIIVGHSSDRIRDDEFAATGDIAALRGAGERLRERLRELAPGLRAAEELAHAAVTSEDPLDGEWTVGAALLHSYEELAQHLGHLELTVDLVLAD